MYTWMKSLPIICHHHRHHFVVYSTSLVVILDFTFASCPTTAKLATYTTPLHTAHTKRKSVAKVIYQWFSLSWMKNVNGMDDDGIHIKWWWSHHNLSLCSIQPLLSNQTDWSGFFSSFFHSYSQVMSHACVMCIAMHNNNPAYRLRFLYSIALSCRSHDCPFVILS